MTCLTENKHYFSLQALPENQVGITRKALWVIFTHHRWCYHWCGLAKVPSLHTGLVQEQATATSTVNPSLPQHFGPCCCLAHPQAFLEVTMHKERQLQQGA